MPLKDTADEREGDARGEGECEVEGFHGEEIRGRKAVDSGQWIVDGGQWTVDGGQWLVDRDLTFDLRPLSTVHCPLLSDLCFSQFLFQFRKQLPVFLG